jgi:hypothetical protein
MEDIMNNQMIAIASVFALTFFLLALRHLLLSVGQSHRIRYVNPALHRVSAESNPNDIEDDSWPFWSSDSETSSANRAGEATGASRAPRHKERPPMRVISGR